jgi:beta-lactamase superfamily II metal-dependent hydrolase
MYLGMDIKTYRTDRQGTITAVSDGKSVTFAAEK